MNQPRRLFAALSSLLVVATLILAPTSAWFAHAADDVATVTSWQLRGNRGTNPSINFLGTTDSQPVVIRTNNIEALRVLAGSGSTGGKVGIGTTSPAFSLDVHGDVNTSTQFDINGTGVLRAPGNLNLFVGTQAGQNTTTGGSNTATGASALQSNTTGGGNTAMGDSALLVNTTGGSNTATGANALFLNSTGSYNTATGGATLQFNTGGNNNTASGEFAMDNNTTGSSNTATGYSSLFFNTTGGSNTAVGNNAGSTSNGLNGNTTGSNNTFIGAFAGPGTTTQLNNATAVGANADVSANNALVLGGTGANAVNVGIGTQTPQSTLQVAGSGSSYGTYLQLPIVSTASGPPAGDCNTTTFAGRMILQDNAGAVTLWVCSTSTGAWVAK